MYILSREALFQIVIHIIVFVFFAFDMDDRKIDAFEISFFLNYLLAVAVVNYALLPLFFYKRKYWLFVILFTILTLFTICVEEFLLEKIYFSDTKGKSFGGVFYGMLDVLPVIFILSSFKYAWDTISKLGQIEQMKTSLMESEMKYLTSEVNPHFLFNNLNNLYSYSLEKSSKTPKIILELSSVLRYMLYNCKETFVPIIDEFKHIENFTKLNELQIEERGTVYLSLPEAIDEKFRIAPLVLILFIENAFKHSVNSQGENIMITIELELTHSGFLTFRCTNSYEDISVVRKHSNGIGLENVKKRLEYLYKDKYDLSIQKSDQMFSVGLDIDLN